jgi:putative ABC transport system ATP-binding protein
MASATAFDRPLAPASWPPRPPASVELVQVGRHYGHQSGPWALRDVSVRFLPGSFTAVVGLSGSGKSTLLQCAAGLDRPDEGKVLLAGEDITGYRRRQLAVLRRRKVGFVFQALNLVPTLTAAENIALPLHLDGAPVDPTWVRTLGERVGIGAQLDRYPDTLSGGQQQRVAIARALVTRPEVIVADEPTAALDPFTSEAVVALLRQAARQLGRTVIIVTHEPSVAAGADRAMVLHAGRLTGVIESPAPGDIRSALLDLGRAA